MINYLVPWTSSEVLKFDNADKMKKGRKMKITGQAFGVGAYEEEDEDIYNRDDMSRYDFSLGNDGEFFCWSKIDLNDHQSRKKLVTELLLK